MIIQVVSSIGALLFLLAAGTPHLTMEKLSRAANMRFVHVPYQGLPPALNDLLGGHVNVMFDTPVNILGHVREGKVKLLAVTGARRLPDYPAIPALGEVYSGVVHEDCFAVVAPPRTPPQIASKLSLAIAETLKLPDVAKRISEAGFTSVGSFPAQTAAMIKAESEKFRPIIAEAGIKIDQWIARAEPGVSCCSRGLRLLWRSRRPTIPTGRSRSSCRFRPAGPPTSCRASSARSCPCASASRW